MTDAFPETLRDALKHGRKMTAEEYFQLPETNIHTELIDGILYVYDGQDGNMPAPTPRHQEIITRILLFIGLKMGANGLYTAPLDVAFDDDIVQPDIVWIAPDNSRCQLTDRRVVGAPDLVIEILSPSTHRQDRIVKFDIYETHGVGEYWIVDPHEQLIEVYIRKEDKLHRHGGYTLGGKFTSPTLNNTEVEVSTLLT